MFLSGAVGAKRLDTDKTNSLRSGIGAARTKVSAKWVVLAHGLRRARWIKSTEARSVQNRWTVSEVQTPSRFRPLARRARMTERPPRVFMRTRKPWVRLRRVTEGWNVRFIGFASQAIGQKPSITAVPSGLVKWFLQILINKLWITRPRARYNQALSLYPRPKNDGPTLAGVCVTP
jgi:hypothetical protein